MELAVPVFVVMSAVADVTISGFRGASGRNGRIYKSAFYVRAMSRAFIVGVALVAVLGGVTAATLYASKDAGAVWRDLLLIGEHLLWWFGVFAVLVFSSLGVYSVSRHEWRTLATTAVLGPFTLARPWVIVFATLSACRLSAGWTAVALSVLSSASILAAGRAVDWMYGRAPPITAYQESE